MAHAPDVVLIARFGSRCGPSRSLETTGRLPQTPVPATLLGAMQTIPSGTSVFLTVNLEAGRRYHLSDDESGIQADFTPK